MKLTDLLDQIDQLDQQATKGPWISKGVEPNHGLMDGIEVYQEGEPGAIAYVQPSDDDAEFIALARTALPQLATALKNVLGVADTILDYLHNPVDDETRVAVRDAIHDAITAALEADDE